jgi:hypothetical protein
MKVSPTALTLVLSAGQWASSLPFQLRHASPIHRPTTNLNSTPFAQIAGLFALPKQNQPASNGVKSSDAASGPGCKQLVEYPDEIVETITYYRNQAHLHQALGLDKASGPGCIIKVNFDDEEEEKITYRNQAHLHAAAAPRSGPGCYQKVGFDDEEEKTTYRNQEHFHKALLSSSNAKAASVPVSKSSYSAAKSATKKKEPAPRPVVEESVPLDPNQKLYGVVSTKKLSKLYDLVVIGGGPAGMAGAVKAAQMGRRAILIDKVSAAFHCFVVSYK